jgi:RsiW-degrading membrane proteinase PrsW (M82 family)
MAGTAPAEGWVGPRQPTWGYHTSLWQWRQPAFWFYAVIMVGTLIGAIIRQAGLAEISAGGWLLAWLLVLVYAVPMIVLIYRLDLYEREPLSLVLGAFLWGGFAATTFAGYANPGWDTLLNDLLGTTANRWSAAIVAPITEEVLKGAGIVFIYLIARDEFDDIMDGFVYGAVLGLGFDIAEDVVYFVFVYGGTPIAVLHGFFVRSVARGLYGHALYSGLVGMGIAYFVTRKGGATTGKRFLVAAGLAMAGVVAHFVHNSPLPMIFWPDSIDSVWDYILLIPGAFIRALPFFAFFVLVLVLARRRERRWLRVALQDEVGLQGLHHDELITLETPKLRRGAVRRMTRAYGPVAGKALKRLQKAHIDLAMIRTRTDDPDHPDLVHQRRYCESLRSWLVQATGHRGSTLGWSVVAPQQPPA